jgi:preprotein translocase subunit YajC
MVVAVLFVLIIFIVAIVMANFMLNRQAQRRESNLRGEAANW